MKTKPFFMLFVGMALVPLALAYAVLKFGWYTPGATAKGEFVQKEIQLDFSSRPEFKAGVWRLVAQPSNSCIDGCKELLYGINQTYIALGKLQKRVEANVFSEEFDLSAYPKLVTTSYQTQSLSSSYLYLVDPFGKVILQYPVNSDREQTIASSKAVLADIKKLLKYSRVG